MFHLVKVEGTLEELRELFVEGAKEEIEDTANDEEPLAHTSEAGSKQKQLKQEIMLNI